MMKRLLAVMLALTLCLTLLPVTAMAEEETEEETASLWLCDLRKTDGIIALSTNIDRDYFQGTSMSMGDKRRIAALYGTETQLQSGTAALVKLEDLTIPDNLSAALIDAESVAEGLYGYAFWLTATAPDENTYVTYNDSSVRVRVRFDISIYESTSFNEGGTTYDYTGEEGSSFQLYMKAADGWDITNVGGGFPPCFSIECLANEDYAIVTVNVDHSTFVFDSTYFIDVIVSNGAETTLAVQARIRINDKRPGSTTNFYTSLDYTEVAVGDGYPGDERVAYYKWRDVGEVSSFTVDLWVQKENDVLKDADLSEAATLGVLEDYGFDLDIQSNYIKVNTTVGRDKKLTIVTHGEKGSEIAFYDVGLIWNSWGSGDDIPQVTIDGVEYTFGLAEIDENAETLSILGPGDGFGGWDPWLGIVMNYGQSNEEPAPAEIYNRIENVKFEIVDYYNTTGPASPCNVSLEAVRTGTWNGLTLSGVVVNDDSPDGAEAKLKTSFTINDEPFSIINVISHGADNVTDHFTLNVTADDDLNDILSSKTAFLNWVKALDTVNSTNVYNQYHSTYAAGLAETVTFELKLPAVTYNEIITVNTRGLDLTLRGSVDESGKRTTMPGLRILRNRFPVYVENIDFVAVEGITHNYGNTNFTCGVLAARAGDVNASAAGDARIGDCTFTGFAYGVRSTDDGCATLNGPCQFFNCGIGYQLDCGGKRGGNGSEGMDSCVFVGCNTAVKILSLNNGTSAYLWRIFNCDFLGNGTDLDVQASGRFYLYRNYFGIVNPNQAPDQWDAWSFRSRTALLNSGDNTQIITNPCRVNPRNVGNIGDNTLYIDTTPGLLTYIPNGDSAALTVDTTTLLDSGETVTINVTDAKDNVQATWTIN